MRLLTKIILCAVVLTTPSVMLAVAFKRQLNVSTPLDAVREVSIVHGPGSLEGPEISLSVSDWLPGSEQVDILPLPFEFPHGNVYSGLGDLTFSANTV